MKSVPQSTIEANQAVHTALATSGEYNKSPHFRPENIAKVRAAIQSVVEQVPQNGTRRLLDLGCGTGFMIDLVHDLVDEVVGIDVTPAMMAQVANYPNVTLYRSAAEHMPFAGAIFDVVSAYSFLDHLDDYRPVLAEASRVLKPGGIFYADLNPNKHFTDNLTSLDAQADDGIPAVVHREIQGMLHNGEYYQKQFGIDARTLDEAEPIKSGAGGFDAAEVVEAARAVGFSECAFRYDWYLGQAVMLHQREAGHAETVDAYLRMALPATRALFKYVRFVLTR